MLGNITKWINEFELSKRYSVRLVVFVVLIVIATQVLQIGVLYMGTINNDSGLQVKPIAHSTEHPGDTTGSFTPDTVTFKLIPYTPIVFENKTIRSIAKFISVDKEDLHEHKNILKYIPGDNISDTSEIDSFKENGEVYIINNLYWKKSVSDKEYMRIVETDYGEDTFAIKKIDKDEIKFDMETQEMTLYNLERISFNKCGYNEYGRGEFLLISEDEIKPSAFKYVNGILEINNKLYSYDIYGITNWSSDSPSLC